jgi:imidazoleglycerol-phosphate dehydratase
MKRGTHVTEPEIPRQGRVERNTKETQIVLQLDIDGAGASKVETGIPFFSHMLEAWAKHGLMDLTVDAKGDLEVDHHHTVEDVGICLGQAFRAAVGDKRRIRALRRVLPADGRGAACTRPSTSPVGRFGLQRAGPAARACRISTSTCSGSSSGIAFNAELTLHVNMHYGENLHHRRGGLQGGGARSSQATRLNPRITGIPSTKGRSDRQPGRMNELIEVPSLGRSF